MVVAVRVARPIRPWHHRLVERLAAAGLAPRLDLAGAGRRADAVALLLAIERRLYRGPAAPPPHAAPDAETGRPTVRPSVTVVLGGEVDVSGPVLEPLFDGQPGEAALTRALLQGRAPRIAIRMRSSGNILAAGLPAIEDPASLTRSMHQVYARLGTLLVHALRHSPGSHGTRLEGVPADPRRGVSAAAFLARGLAGKLGRRLGPTRGRPAHWRIGYRVTAEPGVARTLAWPGERYMPLPDDGERFYADPFPFEHEGRRFVFFEEFPYATGKGVIGVVEIDAAGMSSPPRVVLEQPFHLSYPFVTRLEGGIVMLPETSGARRVQLYRADPFPDRWVPAEVLLDGLEASDATPIWHEGRFWLFATLSGDGGSSWDQLGLFHAPALGGPWRAHRGNPVLIDAGAARPAGAMWHEGGVLMRIAQDCRGGYGAGLSICRVDRLDEDGFAQTVVAHLAPPGATPARGVHTLNRCGDLEVIDLKVGHPARTRS